MLTACPCWWITPTGPTCAFCPAGAATPSTWARRPAVTPATRPCRCSPGSLPASGPQGPRAGGKYRAQRAGAVRLHQPVLSDPAVSDACNRLLFTDYPARLQECCDRLAVLRARLNALAAAQGTALPLALDGPAREPMKLTLDAAALGLTGQTLADHLRQNGMECEYADPRYLVLMFTPENPAEDMARLEAALAELCARASPGRTPCRAPGGILCAGPAGGAPPDRAAGRVCPAGDHPGRVCVGQGLRSAHCVLSARHSHCRQRRGDRPGGAGAFRSLRRGDGLGGETGKNFEKNQGGSARFCGSETY